MEVKYGSTIFVDAHLKNDVRYFTVRFSSHSKYGKTDRSVFKMARIMRSFYPSIPGHDEKLTKLWNIMAADNEAELIMWKLTTDTKM